MSSDAAIVRRSTSGSVLPQKLRKTSAGGEGQWFSENMGLNLFTVLLTFLALYGFYTAFFIFWLKMLQSFGQQLMWFYFGLFLSTFGGMGIFTMYSMSKQEVGWWAPQPPVKDMNNVFCGVKLY